MNSLIKSDKMFNNLFGGFDFDTLFTKSLLVEERITLEDKKTVLSIPAPGMKKEDFNIEVVGNKLCVSYNVREEVSNLYSYGKFSRSWQLSFNHDSERVYAKYEDGLLTIEIPHLDDVKPQQRKIKVH